jgi:cyclic pyranopterin phosphate synthase
MQLPVLTSTLPLPLDLEQRPRSISSVRMLRISVIDRCNLRCVYCMPAQGVPWLPGDDLLTSEEIADVVRAAVEIHEIRRFKLTGGEPTVRPGIVELVRSLKRIGGVDDLSMTTNGTLLGDLAGPLRDAGLDRVTISIDSLNVERFRHITRNGSLGSVLAGLDACERVGFGGIKVNCVVMRSINHDEVAEFARLTLHRNITVRFIEYMPLGESALLSSLAAADESEVGPPAGCGARDVGHDAFVSESESRERIESDLGPLVPIDRRLEAGVGPSVVYQLREGTPKGRIGFISAMSSPFCSTCNRLRLTANGILRSCLFDGGEVNLQGILRNDLGPGRQRRLIADAMRRCVQYKPDLHSAHGNEQMSRLGG